MKNFWNTVLIGLFLFICIGSLIAFSQSAAFQKMNEPIAPSILPQSSPRAVGPALPTATETPTPTATQDYGATAIAYKSELDAANNQIVQAQSTTNAALLTANQLLASQIQVTQQAQQIVINAQAMTATSGYWTANAPATPTPNATSTAERIAAINGASTAIAIHSTEIAAEPTRTLLMAQSQEQAKNVEFYHKAEIILPYVSGVLIVIIAGIVFLIVLVGFAHPKPEPAPVEDPKPEPPQWAPEAKQIITPVKVATPDGNQNWLYQVPCEQEAFFEFCNGVINEHISLAYGNWEGSKSPLTRDDKNSFRAIRNFLLANRFAKSSESTKTLTLTAEGEGFLRAYLDDGNLPHSYCFNPNFKHEPLETAHMSDEHTHEEGGEVELIPIFLSSQTKT